MREPQLAARRTSSKKLRTNIISGDLDTPLGADDSEALDVRCDILGEMLAIALKVNLAGTPEGVAVASGRGITTITPVGDKRS